MKKIVIFENEISIDGSYYPLNTLFFKKDQTKIDIYTVGGEKIYSGSYLSFIDESGDPYLSAESVILALRSSFN